MKVLASILVVSLLATVSGASLRALKVQNSREANLTNHAVSMNASVPPTFDSYYMAWTKGRGIWKWGNALVAYQRHFGGMAGKPVSVAEVGVQSGGSLLMWKTVLGAQIKMFGLDINPKCKKFEEANVKITLGDQGDWKMWKGFFTTVAPAGLDILIDDGGHKPEQMLTTLQSAFTHIHPGGYLAIEDISGEWYLDPFFKPAATFLGNANMAQDGYVHSVHLYPLLMVVRKGGGDAKDTMKYVGNKVEVGDLTAMWTAISTVPPGSQIVVRNPAWQNFLHADALTNFFTNFIGLQHVAFKDTPTGCRTTAASLCTNAVDPISHLQSRVSGVHIYNDHAVIEVPATTPVISCVRRGTEWIHYSGL